jgi:hypothetical protein
MAKEDRAAMKQSSDDVRSRAAAAIDSAEPSLVRADEIASVHQEARASRRRHP